MFPIRTIGLTALLAFASLAPVRGDEAVKDPTPEGAGPVSFMKDVAPILVQNCIACHNPKKSESKYNMIDVRPAGEGGPAGRGDHARAGRPRRQPVGRADPRPTARPRMPYKQDPLPPEKVATIERWVKEGAKYDGESPTEDWTAVLRKNTPVVIPESYPVAVPITALAFSPDNAEVAASGYHEVNFWKVADGSLDRRLRGLAERVYEIAYSPDGKWMATASGDPGQFGAVKLWLAEPRRRQARPRPAGERRLRLRRRLQPRRQAGRRRRRRPRHPRSGRSRLASALATIEDHADWIFDLAFSPDGKRLASASRDKTSKVFDVAKKESLVTFPGHAQTVYTVAFSPDGKTVATGGEDNQVRVWNPDDDGKQVRHDRRLRRRRLQAPVHPRRQGTGRLRRRQDRPRLRCQRRAGPDPPGPRRLGLHLRHLPRRQDRRLGELGWRGPALEPRRRQAFEDHPGRPRPQAGEQRPGIGRVSAKTIPLAKTAPLGMSSDHMPRDRTQSRVLRRSESSPPVGEVAPRRGSTLISACYRADASIDRPG